MMPLPDQFLSAKRMFGVAFAPPDTSETIQRGIAACRCDHGRNRLHLTVDVEPPQPGPTFGDVRYQFVHTDPRNLCNSLRPNTLRSGLCNSGGKTSHGPFDAVPFRGEVLFRKVTDSARLAPKIRCDLGQSHTCTSAKYRTRHGQASLSTQRGMR